MKKQTTLFLLTIFAITGLSAQEELQLSGTITGDHEHPSRIRVTNGRIVPISHLKIGEAVNIWYQDADGDGYGNPAVSSVSQLPSYVQNNDDCNDNDNTINPSTLWLKDSDGDGYGIITNTKTQCTKPSGYVKYIIKITKHTPEPIRPPIQTPVFPPVQPPVFPPVQPPVFPPVQPPVFPPVQPPVFPPVQPPVFPPVQPPVFPPVQTPVFPPVQPPVFPPVQLPGSPHPTTVIKTYATLDCNDNDPFTFKETNWYRSEPYFWSDDGLDIARACGRPKGYSTLSELRGQILFRDEDCDGYGDPDYPLAITHAAAYGRGRNGAYKRGKFLYVFNNSDCDDNDPKLSGGTVWARDKDGDGYVDTTQTRQQCNRPTDHDDYIIYKINQSKEDFSFPFFPIARNSVERDKKIGFTSFPPQVEPASLCRYVPQSYSSQDCDDNDPLLNSKPYWYRDADGDGLGNPGTLVRACTRPNGYVRDNQEDSDDNDPFADVNYIYTAEPLQAINKIEKNTPKIQSIEYFDGLGRPMEQIAIGASPSGKDIVTPIVYDGFGRQTKDYLPYPATQNNGFFIKVSTAESGVSDYYRKTYNDPLGYSEKELEASPLNRILKQGAPGDAWKLGSGHEIRFDYSTNTATEVKRFDAVTNSTYVPSLQIKGYYAAGTLYKNITKDENYSGRGKLNTTEEFKDKQGRVVLKRSYVQEGGSEQRSDTYYVYDDYGNLTYVLPPKLIKKGSYNEANLAALVYQYRYDERNRLVEKQLPGKAREYRVYDKQDRLAATQDGLQRTGRIWLFTKYDQFGRVLYTGTAIGGTRQAVQQAVNNMNDNNEIKANSSTTIDGVSLPYTTDKAWPSAITKLLTVHYYDSYPSDAPNAPEQIFGQPLLSTSGKITAKGLATAVYTKVLSSSGSSAKWQKTYIYYDKKGRVVRSDMRNYLGGYTIVDSRLDFRGKALKTETRHKRDNSATEQLTKDYFTYDHGERLVKHTQQMDDNQSVQRIAENRYDDLGKLQEKKVGGKEGEKPLQTVAYKYNIRDWLTRINNPNTLASKLFALQLDYNEPTQSGTPSLYNGNISQIGWKTASDQTPRGYSYRYDALNRIGAAYFIKEGQTAENYNVTGISYDLNGNIKTLSRNGGSEINTVLIDQLSYTYDRGNRLLKVSDAAGHDQGFADGANSGNDYTYDVNGNLTADKNKGITSIGYNHLNLPNEITFASGGKISYLYSADGEKLSKTVTQNSQSATTDYLSGYQYKNGTLEFLTMAEGYIKIEAGKPVYVFNYTDHLGNVRLSYADTDNDGTPQIVKEKNYYPFGLEHKGYNEKANPMAQSYKYSYNGKELQEELGLDWHDFGARNYNAALGKWFNVDPLAEASGYAYAAMNNNPLSFVDPDGRFSYRSFYDNLRDMGPDDWVQRGDGSIYWDKNATSQATTKSGETHLGRDLTFTFNSYIDRDLWDGPLGKFPAGDKLTSTITLTSNTDADNNLLSVDIKSGYKVHKTGGVFQGLDYFPGQKNVALDINRVKGGTASFEQHAMVNGFEKRGLRLMGYDAVNVAQKLTLGLSGNNLSVTGATDIFPSATLSVNSTQLFKYNQPSFKATHGIIKTQTGVRIPRNPMNDGFIPVYDYKHLRPAPAFYKR